MLAARELHYFQRNQLLVITGAAVDEEIVDGEPVDVLTIRVKERNGNAKAKARNYQLPIDHPLAQVLREMITAEPQEAPAS